MASSNVQALPYTYCDQGDIERLLSPGGLYSRADENGSGIIGTTSQAVIADAINEATETVNFYCWNKHDFGVLASSVWVNRKTAILAAYRICSNRGNPVPDQLVEDAAKVEEDLTRVHDTNFTVPGVALRRQLAPVWSNTRVVPWPYQFRVIRVERNNSSQHNKTSLPQNVDYEEIFFTEPR